jgi:hypothetical protein
LVRHSPGFSAPRLRMSNISKVFGPATVLDRHIAAIDDARLAADDRRT